jgi:PAS domain S-box-containing protein
MSNVGVAGHDKTGIIVIFVVAAGLLIASIAFTYWMGLLALESSRQLGQERSALQHLDDAFSVLKDAETGQRGYLLTGEEAYLEPYNKALAEIRTELEDLRQMASDGELPEDQVEQFGRLTGQKLAELEETVQLRRDRGQEAALDLVRTGQGKQIMDKIRSMVATIEGAKEAQLVQTSRHLNRATKLRTMVFALTSLMSLVLLGWIYQRISHEMARREAATRELVRERASLQESDERFRTMANAMPQLAWIARGDGYIYWYNHRWYEYTGTTPGQMEGWDWQSVHDPQQLPIVLERWKGSIATGEPFDMVFPLRGKDGVFRPFLTRVMPLRDGQGQVRQWFGTNTDVSEQQQAEQLLRAGEQRYRSFVEASAQIVWTTNARGEVDMAIPSWQAYTGQTAEQARGFGWMEGIRAEDRPRVAEAWQSAFASRGLYEVEYLLKRHDGAWRDIVARGVPVLNADGTVREYVGTCIDVTDRRRAEEAVRESQERLSGIVDSAMDAIISINDEQRITLFNAAAERMFGYSSHAVCGQPLDCLIPERFRAAHQHHVGQFAAEGVTSRKMGALGEISGRRADGEEFPIEASISHGSVAGQRVMTVILRDITERKRSEESLRQSEQRLRAILDALPVAVFLSDEVGNVIFTNAAVEQIWGINALVTRQQYGEYKGRWLESGLPVEPEEWALARTLDTGEPFENELVQTNQPDGGRKILHNFSIPLRSDRGRFLGGIVVTEDVTQRIEAQEQLRKAKEAAEHTAAELARSNKDLEQFAYVASHDLQEPLRMITGYLQLLAERYRGRLDEKADKYINYAVDGAQRMSGLIRDLLAFSRVNTRGEPLQQIPSQEAFDYALRNLEKSIETAGALVRHDRLPAVRADKTQLVQLFQNLIGNAIKFRSPDRPPEIHVTAQPDRGQWLFSVRDNGIGFEQQYEKKIFLIFQRLHERGQYAGTGIGLAICRRIVERHGGRIWATGELDKGATFFFTIPG